MFSQSRGNLHTVFAPAKVNLFLEVHGPRPDGFTEIVTLMATVGLYDTLHLRTNKGGRVTVEASWAPGLAAAGNTASPGELPSEDDNLVTKALRRFQQASACQLGMQVQLTKRIPAGAGLGGASSDAAAALWAANRIWGVDWSAEKLQMIAAELGSDVPFFIPDAKDSHAQPAICRGRGEKIERCPVPAGLHLVIVRPPVSLSTGKVYQRCTAPGEVRDVEPLVAALTCRDPKGIRSTIHNQLTPPAKELTPWIERLEFEFGQQSCWASQMTGSGSCYFGLMGSAGAARRAASRLRSRGLGQVWATQTL